jgi:cytochrome c553
MLHKIHMGEELDKAETYTVVGFGATTFPNNFTAYRFEEVKFPALPGRAKHCDKCHGADNDSWKEPAERNHPTEQDQPTLSWRVTCGACHDSDEATAHLESQTSPISGAEACAICHGRERDEAVEFVHKNR